MFSYAPIQFKCTLTRSAAALAVIMGLTTAFAARADDHYVSLSKVFPVGKCSPVAPNFELMVSLFAGGEFTEHRIRNNKGEVIQTITTFINKAHDQWATVGSKRDEKVIFCLYASGVGRGSVSRQAIKTK